MTSGERRRLERIAEDATDEKESKEAMVKLRTINPSYHWCADWDFMVICDEYKEFEACLCAHSGKKNMTKEDDSPFLDCEILCTYIGDQEEEERSKNLGLKSENEPIDDIFLPFCIDLRDIVAMRMPADKDSEPRTNETVVYINGDHFTINVPFAEVKRRWQKIKGSATNTTL